MVLLGDDPQVEVHLGHLEIVVILTQDRCTVCTECTLVAMLKWKLISVRLEIVLILMQDM
jgi:hypothetical protein